MTNEELIAKIKAEIERRIDAFANICMDEREKGNNESCAYYQGKIASCEGLLSFLSTLESEKPIHADLEEAADEMAIIAFPEKKSYSTVIDRVVDYNAVDRKNYRDGIIAGAKWQAEQLLKSSPLPEDTVLFQKGVEEGKRLMMDEAVEVNLDFTHQITLPFDGPGFGKKGDKVRIIIVKED